MGFRKGRGGLVASFTGSGGLLEFDLEGSAAKGFRVRGLGFRVLGCGGLVFRV